MIDPHDVAARVKLASGDLEGIACYYCAVVCLLWYDYFLTFSEEVEYVWKKKLSISSALFYVIRYSALLSSICEVVATQGWLKNDRFSCVMIESFVMGSIITLYTSAAVFSAMRVYALYARNIPLSMIILVLALGNPAIYLYVYSKTAPLAITSMTALSCGIWLTTNPAVIYYKWLLGARATSIAADALVVLLTWLKTKQALSRRFHSRMPLMTVLISDGTVCFLVLLILNVISLAVWHDVFYSNPMTMWISIFTAILTCRFMLDLRKAATPDDQSGMSQLTTIHFGQGGQAPIGDGVESEAVEFHFPTDERSMDASCYQLTRAGVYSMD